MYSIGRVSAQMMVASVLMATGTPMAHSTMK